jgi:phosphoribosylformylglycinamidine synthase II
MTYRIEVLAHNDDGRAKSIENIMSSKGKPVSVRVADIYTSENDTLNSDVFTSSVCNPVTQKLNDLPNDFDWALEIGFLPGVTDNVGGTASEFLELAGATNDNDCFSSRLYLIKGDISRDDVEALSHTLSNSLIQRAQIKSVDEFKTDNGMDVVIPRVQLTNDGHVADDVDLNVSDDDLNVIGSQGIVNQDGTRRGPLGMSLPYMKAVQEHFKSIGRNPTDIELETLAQTWSEHCKHTIFASPIDEVTDGLYKHYIKRATKEIREARGEDDICVSVFSDNAGGIIFDDEYLIADKVETHNSPSALDPFGGSITGIVGVNRDCMGFGMGAKPVINRYGFCLADPRTNPKYYRDKNKTIPVLSPETIMNGVIAGVEAGGNQSGIPTPQGFVHFDDRFVGKPLVFVGTIGLIPRDVNGKPGHEKCAQPGDKIVIAGGRVGRDGIHGATFSSVALDEGSPATAVQIGDPITQKKMSDAIIKEIRDLGLYTAITDNGAGGMSSSIGEMAEQSGGFHVELDKVPLKYPGMAPWEIWISESQERMTMAVPEGNVDDLIALFEKRGVEAKVVGTYTDSGQAHITWNDETIMDMEMDFLHDGNPETPLTTTFTRGGDTEPDIAEPADYAETLNAMLSRLNICSKEFISAQYDHNVQGTAVLGPLQGKGRVYADASVTKPTFKSDKGVVLSEGLFPRYGDIDTHDMAQCGVDFAVRAAVAAGVDFKHLALLDNFCWCSSDEPERLGQLKRAVSGIYHLSKFYATPFISGKDSMFNDFKGYDENGDPVLISAPPTLLASAIGVIPHVDQSISITPKAVGDRVYVLGRTKDECGASEYYDHLGHIGNNVPEVDAKLNQRLYTFYSRAARKKLIASAMPVGYGGLGVTLAKKAIASQMGLDIDVSKITKDLRADKALFSESAGRIVVTVAPQNVKAFEKTFDKLADEHCVTAIGHVAYGETLHIKGVLKQDVAALETAYKKTLKDY